MLFKTLFGIIYLALLTKECLANPHQNQTKQFPNDFVFGVGTSAYQIEGAWNIVGKGPSTWDEFTHLHPELIADHQNGDVTANSYEYFMDDIAAIKEMSMDFYRFSIAWSRVLPNGDASNINEKGIEYYNNLIEKLLENNITPMVTMFHWDLPQKLQKLGGFANPVIIQYFEAYARLLFQRFGDRVKLWITFNAPNTLCNRAYGDAVHAPALNFSGVGDYLCSHNVLKAHAVVYHMYQKSFRSRFNGKVGVAINTSFYYSETNDTKAVEQALQFLFGWFATPIFGSVGNYPSMMMERVAIESYQQGLKKSRLPTFSKQWIETVRGTADFLGVNYYTSRFVKERSDPKGIMPSFDRDKNIDEIVKDGWKRATLSWLYSVPQGLGDLLRWLKKEYNNPDVYITENGWSDQDELEDNGRIQYIREHLKQVQDVVLNNECNVKGYSVWSVIDSFEWENGYTGKFGLYYVNMTSPKKERIPKQSSRFMRTIAKSHQIP